jgi:hypothetical protein
MLLQCSKDMSVVHVSTCTSYEFSALTPVMWKLWHWYDASVFLHLIAKMCDWFLEQQINIQFCVKLGKNASDTCAMLLRLMGEKLWKKSSVSELHKWFKESLHVEITSEDNAHHFLQYQGHCSLWIQSTRPNSQSSLLCGNTEEVMWSCTLKKAWTSINDWILIKKNSQSTLCQAVSGLKINYWNVTPTLFPLLGSKWLLAVSRNKACLKGA